MQARTCAVFLATGWLLSLSSLSRAAEPPDFGREIQPILADKCYACHGPDAAQREADLRLDRADDAFSERDGKRAIVPGSLSESALWERVASPDDAFRMPPADSGLSLSDAEVQKLKEWISGGAVWTQHWSFRTPPRPTPPQVRNWSWIHTPVDQFILSRLEEAGWHPSPVADRPTLIRRVTLDLTGLPPTPEEVDRFLADQRPDAYERLVERLLHSPRYGERMAIEWLDAARYADTSGYQTDGFRSMWRWRDWVIEAFNRNLSFDRFTTEQLAGDLLSNPTTDQLIATGFNRNHRANSEGGIIDDEFLLEYAVDRVETTGTIWLGLTVGCARCHDHKYDPLTQKDFYQLLAYFNNVPERGRVYKHRNSEPFILAPTPSMRDALEVLQERLAVAEERWLSMQDRLRSAEEAWQKTEPQVGAARPLSFAETGVQLAFDRNFHAGGGLLPELTLHGEGASFEPGPVDQALHLDGTTYLDGGTELQLSGTQAISVTGWIRPTSHDGAILSLISDDLDRERGFSLHLKDGRLLFHIGPRWIDDGLRIASQETLPRNEWHHVAVTYDGSERAAGVRMYVDGNPMPTAVLLDKLTGGYSSQDEPLRVGFGPGRLFWRGALDEVHLYQHELSAEEVQILSCADSVAQILKTPANGRSTAQQRKLAWHFLQSEAGEPFRSAYDLLRRERRAHDEFVAGVPTTMVMRERPQPAMAQLLKRGAYDQPLSEVAPGTPDWLSPLPEPVSSDRLGLARWLTAPDHPLTARVTVNRYWQRYFGIGLVATSEDFGTQGARPSAEPLLNWLADEFVRSGWDVKAMQRQIVLSATYRQSSHVGDGDDPDNHLLARAPRIRLPAELIRDQALAAAGLLESRIGGPSVKPYQPAGLWQELGSTKYEPDTGAELYRRSMYTFWKRTVPPAGMATFDGPTREFCQVRRSRTNTPLQALALLNDVTYVEAARELARRVLQESPTSDEARLHHMVRLLLAREATAEELPILVRTLDRARQWFKEQPDAADEFLAIGTIEPAALERNEWAAFTTVASVILNLDETITRE